MSIEHLPVDDCLMLRENGFDWAVGFGDWYYDQDCKSRSPKLNFGRTLKGLRYVKIPTLPQLLDFARELAGKRLHDPIALSYRYIFDDNEHHYRIEGYRSYYTALHANAPTPELALVALIEQILKQKEVTK